MKSICKNDIAPLINTLEGVKINMIPNILLWLLLYLSLTMLSCTKNGTEKRVSLEDGKSTVVYDLAGDTDASMNNGVDGKEQRSFFTFLFRFKDRKQIWIRNAADSAKWLKTKDWDLAFTGPYNSELFVNNGSRQYNPGFGGLATSAVIMMPQTYESLLQAPDDNLFDNSEVNKFGWASSDNSPGWFFYTLQTHIAKPMPNRCYAIRLSDGKYAKLQIVSPYKGNPPSITDANWPRPYFTFRYYVQQDGSKNLKTQ